MKIAGLQKVSTIDYPGEIACIVFLYGCNFRCGFCYNPDLVVKECKGSFSEEGILNFLKKRVGKLDGVCITGGEPLMSLDFDFVKKIRELGFKVKIDTNGSFPDKLKEVIDLGLVDYVAMDIKGTREDYSEIVGVGVDISKIEESMRIVNDFGKGKIGTRIHTDSHGFGEKGSEFRTTVVGRFHDVEKIREMGEWMGEVCGGKPRRIFLQGFKSNKEGMIDSSFFEESDILEGELENIRDGVGELFGEVGIRC